MLKIHDTSTTNTENRVRATNSLQNPFLPNLDTFYSSPSQINVLLHNGVQEAQQNNRYNARAYFGQVLKLDPLNELALLWMGYLAVKPADAMSYFEQVLRVNPQNSVARQYYEKALHNQQVATDPLPEVSPVVLQASKKTSSTIPWLGELLLQQGLINQAQLEIALSRQQHLANKNKWKPLGEILIQLGYLNRYQLDDSLRYQKETRTY
jgi:hypothetical protein